MEYMEHIYSNVIVLHFHLFIKPYYLPQYILQIHNRWQIKPRNLDVTNVDQALESALRAVAAELGTEAEYNIEANLYKLLLYEPGCFFAR